MSDESAFDSCEFQNEFANEFEAGFDDEFNSLIADETLDQEDFWGEEFAPAQNRVDKKYIEQEFELGASQDLVVDLFAESQPAQPNIRIVVRTSLAKGMTQALSAHASADFLDQVMRSLDVALHLLHSTMTISNQNGSAKALKQKVTTGNGHDSGLKQNLERQPLIGWLKLFRGLVQRYAKRGLQEWEVLEDAIAALPEQTDEITLPILAGLAARIALLPLLDRLHQPLNAPLRENLVRAATKATALLHQHQALAALPALAINVGQHTLQCDRSLSQLPQDFYQAATRVAANPHLQQKLAQFNCAASTAGAIAPHQLPTTLRINGPIEILLRRPPQT